MIEEAFERCQSEFVERVTKRMVGQGVDEDDARKRVYDNMLPTYRKAFANIFVTEMLWFHAMRKDPVYLSVKNTVSDLKLIEDYDNEEAWKSAVNKRKFLFNKILKEYDPPELSGPEDDDDDDTQREQQQQVVSKENNEQVSGGSGGSIKLAWLVPRNRWLCGQRTSCCAKVENVDSVDNVDSLVLRRKTQQRLKN